MKLIKKIEYTGKIKLLTGMHIGGSNMSMGIGGIDSYIVRNPIDNKPYIPGSSLKGKMRSLIELTDGTSLDGGPTIDPETRAGKLFGVSKYEITDENGNKTSLSRPSRLIVRDALLCSDDNLFINCELPYAESKTENSINRITAVANPRTIERVPAGAEFSLNMVLNIFENEKETELTGILAEAIALLQKDYIGGNGSRGYGQVEITFSEKTKNN